jgi:hypothetical protein
MLDKPKLDIAKRVGQYIQLRDLIKREDDAHKERMKPKRELLEQLNGVLLGLVDQAGGESVRTEAGTVYRTEKKSASLADPDAFMRFVISSEAWDLLDRKANATAVFDFIAENNAPPPGVNANVAYVVGVRRSA